MALYFYKQEMKHTVYPSTLGFIFNVIVTRSLKIADLQYKRKVIDLNDLSPPSFCICGIVLVFFSFVRCGKQLSNIAK